MNKEAEKKLAQAATYTRLVHECTVEAMALLNPAPKKKKGLSDKDRAEILGKRNFIKYKKP